ncbi:hypothetical protein A1O7_07412 [Cladophialophora yegresii CBS 114405]|uniref:Aminoglycoside phosphotransferase domain-containing protein n=1 Tax=Cladophialophora yegresii CBS 114405 TaxID=1182544 RepID=W9VNG1_9EURO|nr:uncharacterized protein A1O7_07412 [Cladophialophora yegresii CBS 114405]EXJ57068.1 hypothetical protein A1O7_07412 [Cladophialophora yegresii CBS 114405]
MSSRSRSSTVKFSHCLAGETDEADLRLRIPGGDQRPSNTPDPGPSTTTAHELEALKKFHETSSEYTPVLVNFMSTVQPAEGPLPGGYLTFLVMTKMPGDSLWNMYYWGMSDEERKQIREKFLVALDWIYEQGIEPVDCGLRNILWERASKKCTIIDFELWRDTDASFGDETKELQRWGLVRQPAAKNHWEAWNQMFR